MTEVVYENATKVVKSVHWTTNKGSGTSTIQPGSTLKMEKNLAFRILKTETVE